MDTETDAALDRLAEDLHATRSYVVRLAVLELARRHQVQRRRRAQAAGAEGVE